MPEYPTKSVVDLALVVNVRDFGATGDGNPDAAKANSKAIDAALVYAMHKGSPAQLVSADGQIKIVYPSSRSVYSTLGGATLYFPAGTYIIERPIVLPATGTEAENLQFTGFCVHLEGENTTSTVIAGRADTFGTATPNEVRGLIEWDPRFRFEAVEYGGRTLTPPGVTPADWTVTRKICSWVDQDDDAEDILERIWNDVDLFREYAATYDSAVASLESHAARGSFSFCVAMHQSIRNLTLYCAEHPRVEGGSRAGWGCVG